MNLNGSMSLSRVMLGVGLALALQNALVADEVEDKISKTFTVQNGGKLQMKVDRGSIDVKGGTGDAVSIEVKRVAKAGTKARAEELLKEHTIEFKQEGNDVAVTAKQPKKVSNWWGGGNNLKVQYLVTVPRSYNVDVHTAGGGISMAGIQGAAVAGTSGGGLKFSDIEGKVDGETSGGSVGVAGARGGVRVRTSGGSINLKDVTGDVEGRTSGGSIEVKNVVGKLEVGTSGGGIELEGVQGEVEARTSGGSVSAAFAEGVTKPVKLGSSGGSITVELSAEVAVDLDARTSAGRVTSDLPVVSVVQGDPKGGVLKGKINGGGPLLELRTSGGGIRIKKK